MELIRSITNVKPMAVSGRFCPACGEPIDTPVTTQSDDAGTAHHATRDHTLCTACYLERTDLIDAPTTLTVHVCAGCGAVRRDGTWVDQPDRDHTDLALDHLQDHLGVHIDATDVDWTVTPEQTGPNTIRLHTTFTGTLRGTPVEETVTIPVTIATGTCTRCSRIAGNYYAATVQLRATDRTPTPAEEARTEEIAARVVADRIDAGDRNAFVTEITTVNGGIDIKVSTARIGEIISRRLTAEFGGSYEAAETLVTEDKDGNEVYRVSYAVRLPRFTPGDIIDPGDNAGPVLVRSVTGNLKGRRLTTGEQFEAHQAYDASSITRLGTTDDASLTTLVTVEDDHALQVLDPDTHQAVTIPRPTDFDTATQTVRVFKSELGIHVLPDD